MAMFTGHIHVAMFTGHIHTWPCLQVIYTWPCFAEEVGNMNHAKLVKCKGMDVFVDAMGYAAHTCCYLLELSYRRRGPSHRYICLGVVFVYGRCSSI